MNKELWRLPEQKNSRAYDKSKIREKECVLWLNSLSKQVRRCILFSALAGILQGVCIIIQYGLLAWLLQQAIILQLPIQQLISPLTGLLMLLILRSLCSYYAETTGFEAGAQVKQNVHQQLLEHINRLGVDYTRQQQSGELVTIAIEQVDALRNYFTRYLPQMLLVKILPALMLIPVFIVNWVVGMIYLVTGPLIPLFMALVGMGATAAHRSQFLVMSRMGGYFLDRVQGLETLKLFAYEQQEVQNIAMVTENFRARTMRVLRIAFLSSAVLEFFSAVAIALVAVYVGLGLLGLIRIGPAASVELHEALFVLLLAPEFFAPLRQLAVFYHDKAAAIAAADNILKVLQTDPAEPLSCQEIKPGSQPGIVLQNVSKTYGRQQILQNFNLHIKPGEKVAIVGESGAGKTTLINLLLGFEPPTSGEIMIDGVLISKQLAAEKISWLGQQAYIFCASIYDNMTLFQSEISPEKVMQAAQAAGIGEFCEQLPQAYETGIGERGYGLSGGQVQRIALTRALLKRAPIIVLDEPTAHLDAEHSERILDDIERLFTQQTIVMATHDPVAIARMQRIVEL